MTKRMIQHMTAITTMATLLAATIPTLADEATGEGRWRVSAMGGRVDYEGDESVRDAALGSLIVGYDLSRHWTLEGVVEYSPELKSSHRVDWATGERISRLNEGAGRDLSDTSAIRFALDGLLRLAPEHRLDPYLAVGLGVAAYQHDFDQRYEPLIRTGVGLFVNLTDRWALRLDSRAVFAGSDTEVNLITTAGLVFRTGAKTTRSAGAIVVPQVAETVTPSVAETVKMFELNLSFDPGKWEIKSEYRAELDVIGQLLETKPASRARIEGHEQAEEGRTEKDAQTLSKMRAGAVLDYFKDTWKIRASRLESVGLGTSRPKTDPAQSSQRIEVYVTVP